MGTKARTGLTRATFLDRYIQRFGERLEKFQPFLSRRKPSITLEEFDEQMEDLIGQVFGQASDQFEAYLYAKIGEGGLLPEEAQESGTHDVERESLQQRKRVLESCVAELQFRKRLLVTRRPGLDGQALQRLKVEDYMASDVRSIHSGATIKEAGRALQKWKVGSLIVDDGSRYIGIVTDSDLSRKAVARGLDPNSTTVLTCMSKPVVTIELTESLSDALALMKEAGVRHLPVTADRTIIGVLSVSDILRAIQDLSAARMS
ncbi:MAG TPA: CBS domain-containing protein [Nitrospiraceae bacterium]|nr:CBS domain-containing protein [Nitrospiraceae bacterium]